MPRLKHFKPLYKLTIRRIAGIVTELCFRSTAETEEETKDNTEAVSRFVQEVPPYAVHKYMEYLLALLLEKASCLDKKVQESYLRAALHPECREFKTGCMNPEYLVLALIKNVDVMTRLQKFRVTYSLGNCEGNAVDILAKNICHLRELRSVSLANLCTLEVLLNITENCPYIEKLTILCNGSSNAVSCALSKCKGLKWLKVIIYQSTKREKMKATDILFLLDNLPNLEYFHIQDINKFLDEVEKLESKKMYRIRSFGSKISNDADLVKACSYFPELEEIRIENIHDYSPVTTLRNLKKMEVDDKFGCFKDFPNVMSLCSQLTALSLRSLSLREIFKSDQGAKPTFPELVTLKLLQCKQVDINAVAMQCPNLTKLEYCGSVSEQLPLPSLKSNLPFCHLKNLKFEDVIPSHVLFVLSSCLELRDLRMSSSRRTHLVTNDLFKSVLQINPLEKLRSMILSSDDITTDIMPLILGSLSALKSGGLIGKRLIFSDSEKEELNRQLMPFDLNCALCDLRNNLEENKILTNILKRCIGKRE